MKPVTADAAGDLLPPQAVAGVAAMVAHHGDTNPPRLLLVKNVIREPGYIGSPYDSPQGRVVTRILQCFRDRPQEGREEAVGKRRPGFGFLVIQNLPDVPHRETMVNHLHAERPKALRNSS